MDTPMKSSAADRLRPTPWDVLVVLCVAALALILSVAGLHRQTGEELTAVVTVDGETVVSLPLYAPHTTEQPQTVTLDDIPYTLVLEYKTGAIRVAEAHCPGKDCQHMGWIDQAGEQIVCLPNRLVITMTGEGAVSFDAVTG